MIAPPEQTAAPKLRPERRELERMLGDWAYKGENYATSMRPASKFTGKMSCRPFLSGTYVYSADATTLVQKEEISLDDRTWMPSFEAWFTKNKGS